MLSVSNQVLILGMYVPYNYMLTFFYFSPRENWYHKGKSFPFFLAGGGLLSYYNLNTQNVLHLLQILKKVTESIIVGFSFCFPSFACHFPAQAFTKPLRIVWKIKHKLLSSTL